MFDTLMNLSPILLFFLLGIFLNKVDFAKSDNADFLLKFVFFVTLPALVLLRLSQTVLSPDKIYLPIINIFINLACMGISFLIFKPAGFSPKTMGSIFACTMIANNVFMFPFILAEFGDSGFADAVLFDFGNSLTTATITYLIAFRYGSHQMKANAMIIKLLRSSLFWALLLAIFLSCFSLKLPQPVNRFLEGVGSMTSPLVLIALGIFFKPDLSDIKLVSLTVLIRVGTGLAVGTLLALFFGLSGQTLSIVILCSAAPVGFMAITFSSIADLDRPFASKTVSLSILLGLIYIPVLIFIMTGTP